MPLPVAGSTQHSHTHLTTNMRREKRRSERRQLTSCGLLLLSLSVCASCSAHRTHGSQQFGQPQRIQTDSNSECGQDVRQKHTTRHTRNSGVGSVGGSSLFAHLGFCFCCCFYFSFVFRMCSVITFVAQLAPAASSTGASAASDLSQLTIYNSFRTCRTTAAKISAYNPTQTVSPADPSTQLYPTNSSSSSSNSTATTAAAAALPRDAFVGDYTFDSSCVPSSSCCCAVGALHIAPVYDSTALPPPPAALASFSAPNATAANRSQQIIFSTDLDGGSACVGMQNVSAAFVLSNATDASFSFPPVSLNALLSQSSASAGLDTITFTNSMVSS